ncbi:MAG TPA: trypsin-like peptidase domain-containing protein [Rhizomicrobium sp.]|nr:trypsin-like peptidase domain-containing protein [Rhizomicrobium sp.]
MTRSPSSLGFLALLLAVCGCAQSSGLPATAIAQPEIAAAYLPLHGRVHLGLDSANGAAVAIAPGIAVTNAHNANLLQPKSVIGVRQDYDLLFFRTPRNAAPQTAAPVIGQGVTAYGQGGDSELRVAHGVVREIKQCPGCTAPAYFVFAGNAGPGFSGGPVLDGSGHLVGITFGYKDEARQRLIYAYDMSRVWAEFSALRKPPN